MPTQLSLSENVFVRVSSFNENRRTKAARVRQIIFNKLTASHHTSIRRIRSALEAYSIRISSIRLRWILRNLVSDGKIERKPIKWHEMFRRSLGFRLSKKFHPPN